MRGSTSSTTEPGVNHIKLRSFTMALAHHIAHATFGRSGSPSGAYSPAVDGVDLVDGARIVFSSSSTAPNAPLGGVERHKLAAFAQIRWMPMMLDAHQVSGPVVNPPDCSGMAASAWLVGLP